MRNPIQHHFNAHRNEHTNLNSPFSKNIKQYVQKTYHTLEYIHGRSVRNLIQLQIDTHRNGHTLAYSNVENVPIGMITLYNIFMFEVCAILYNIILTLAHRNEHTNLNSPFSKNTENISHFRTYSCLKCAQSNSTSY